MQLERDGQAATGTGGDRVFGAIGATMLLLAAVFLVRSLLPAGADDGPDRVPSLTILAPAPGAMLDHPAELRFDAGATLRPGATGWSAGALHVHLLIGTTEVMPAAGDLTHLGGTRYLWRLPRVGAGESTLRLTWSDANHREIEAGASVPVPVRFGDGSVAPPASD
jgi:hypothetical protein